MEQNNNYYQQNWNLQPTPPKKNKRWVLWVTLGVVFVGLLSGLFYFVSKVGKNFGGALNKMSTSDFYTKDSISISNQFYNLQFICTNDSSLEQIADKLALFKNESDSIYNLLNSYENGFKDTLGEQSGISGMDQRWGRNYFIKTGRARNLKLLMVKFQNEVIQNLPEERTDSSLYAILRIDEMGKNMPGFMKKMMDFENLNFNQPVFSIRLNFSKLKKEIGLFDRTILNIWTEEINATQQQQKDSIK